MFLLADRSQKIIRSGGYIIAMILMILLFEACQGRKKATPVRDIFSDLECVTPDGKAFCTNDTSYRLESAHLKTAEQAHSGNFSLKLTPEATFGLGCLIPNVRADEYFIVSIWKKGEKNKGILVIDVNGGKYYNATRKSIETDFSGWEHIQLEFFIPPTIEEGVMKVYVWNPDTVTVYFDDLQIISRPRKEYPEYDQDAIRIFIDSVDMITINRDRKKAFEQGVLETDNSSWVPGILFLDKDNELMKAKIRLKGDWLDHLSGDKWSFRIKLNRDYGWRHMRIFSIQTPEARDFLNEWVLHQLLDQEDVLNTTYGFIPVYLKEKSLGYYAYEEHFDKHLVESRNRREGPIMKFTEEAFWAILKTFSLTKYYHKLPCFETAVIEPFNVKQTMTNPALKAEFLIAQNLLYEYKNTLRKPSELFDVDKLARYYALCDVTKAWHCIPWHNQRFYYNPVLCRLEPIAFDGYTHEQLLPIGNQTFLGEFDRHGNPEIESNLLMHFYLFEDPLFTETYIKYLEIYSSDDFIESFMQKINGELTEYENQLRKEFPLYYYDRQFLLNNAAALRDALGRYKKMVTEDPEYARKTIAKFKIFSDYDTTFNEIFPDYYVKAYMEQTEDGIAHVRVFNDFTQDILLLGTGKSAQRMRYPAHPEPTVPAFIAGKDQSVNIESDTAAQFLYFMVKGRFQTHIVPIQPWPYPTESNPRRELEALNVFSRDTSFIRDQDKVIFSKGKHVIDEFLIIPANHRVYFDPGCILDIRNRAGFISYSPVFLNGTENDPVVITSSDSSAMGFTVLQARKRSMVQHAIFEELNTLDYKGWTLTGAVTFYESDVDIDETVIRNNHCEDAINFIRCDYKADHLTFQNTFGDAFDNDFCTGSVTHALFINPGNDAIDFSGSTIGISNCQVRNAKDKGISGGEKSVLTIRNCEISNCNIGIASKDLSILSVYDTQISQCNYGITVFKKKPEYGPAILNASNLKLTLVQFPTWVEEKSKVILNDSIIPDDKKDVALKFY